MHPAISEQALLIAAGSRREYSIGHGDGEKSVSIGGFPERKKSQQAIYASKTLPRGLKLLA